MTNRMPFVTLRDMASSAEISPRRDPGLSPSLEPTSYHRRLLVEHVPPVFIRDLIRAVLWAYGQADEICRSHFDDPEAHDSIGDIRRGLIEGVLRSQAVRHGGQHRALRNAPGTAFYSRVQFGNMLLTQSSVDLPGRLRRPADFREEMAAQSQLNLLQARRKKEKATPVYAIVYHGHYLESRKNKGFNVREPGFIGITFPNEDCTGSLAMIDLTAQLRYEIDSAKTADVEHVDELDLGFTAKTGTKIEDEEASG